MNKVLYHIIILLLTVFFFASCGSPQSPTSKPQESREAKRLMQGVWNDDNTQVAVFRMKGDTVFYADSTSLPAHFRVVGDTLYVGSSTRYKIERQSEHVLWLKNHLGELLKLSKSDDAEQDKVFDERETRILTLTEVLKRDTVVFYNGERYHLYVAINPTKYKVMCQAINNDGLEVENVYYDNIIHLSIYHGAQQVFSRDFRKPMYKEKVPVHVLSQAVLNDMEFDKVDAQGFHLRASVCRPDDALCYMVGHTVSFSGKLTTQLLEY